MINLNDLLNDVIKDATSVGFPMPTNLERKVYIDYKRYDRAGACYRYILPERYEIHLSETTLKADSNEIKSVLAHEVLHANFLTMEHNCFWKMFQQRMNVNLGYMIQEKYSWNKILKK